MRVSISRLARPSLSPTSPLGTIPAALLPPIPLYRRLLRAHRKHLDRRMRLLGDEYIKSEFRAHRNVDNPMHIVRPYVFLPFFGMGKCNVVCANMSQIGFLTEWQMYAQKIEGDAWKGEKIDKGKVEKMSGEFGTFGFASIFEFILRRSRPTDWAAL
jgi:hypothetical protein